MLSITASRTTKTGNGSLKVFDIADGANGIYFQDASEINVRTRDPATNIATDQVQGVDYTVSGAGTASGQITFVTAPTDGHLIDIWRTTPLTQLLDIGSAAFDPDDVESAFDKTMRAIQDLSERQTFRYAWVSGNDYEIGDVATNDGSSYIVTADHTAAAANEPGTGANWTDYWSILAAGGEDGAAGADGADGADGSDGADGVSLNWQGSWTTATNYAVNDGVLSDLGSYKSSYICKLAHTSGASSEPGVGASWSTYWDLLAEGGIGPGGGDLLSTNNLSDVTSASTSRTNLGLGSSDSVTFGDVTVGTAGSAAELELFGASTGNTEGGAILLYNGDDYDDDGGTARLYWWVRSDSGLFEIGLHNKAVSDFWIDQDGITYVGYGSGDVRVGQNDTTPALLYLYGGGATEAGAELRLYHAADHDTTINYLRFRSNDDYFLIEDDTGQEAFRFAANGDVYLAKTGAATVYVGDPDVARGLLFVAGDNADDGGLVRLMQSANEDGTIEYIDLLADGGEFVLQNNSVVGFKMKTDGTLVMPQHTSGILQVDGSGNVSAGSSTSWTAHADNGTAFASDASVDVTIPAGTQRIRVVILEATFSASSIIGARLGDSGGVETSGYESYIQGASSSSQTTYFIMRTAAGTSAVTAFLDMELTDTHTWVMRGQMISTGGNAFMGRKALSAELTTLQIRTSAGTITGGKYYVFTQ